MNGRNKTAAAVGSARKEMDEMMLDKRGGKRMRKSKIERVGYNAIARRHLLILCAEIRI